jgi:hypothetical protein
MDFQKAKRPLEDSRVYLLIDSNDGEREIIAAFATKEAAEMALKHYLDRAIWNIYYWIKEVEVLDKTTISEGEGSETTTMGKGHNH